MKQAIKSLVLGVALISFISANAQISITKSNHPANSGVTQRGQYLKLGGFQLPLRGTGMKWFYGNSKDSGASMKPRIYKKVLDSFFIKAGATRYYQQEVRFLGNVGLLDLYENNDTNGNYFVGYGCPRQAFSLASKTFNTADSVILLEQKHLQNPQFIIKYPCNFNTYWTAQERVAQDFVINIKALNMKNVPGTYVQNFSYLDTVSGWGQMTVPVFDSVYHVSKPYDVIMVKSDILQEDSFYLDGKPASSTILSLFGAKQGMDSSYVQVNFYRENYSTPLMVINANSKYTSAIEALYDPDNTTYTITGVKEIVSTSGVFAKLFPNPSNGNIMYLQFLKPETSSWKISVIDITGKEIHQQIVSGSGIMNEKINLNNNLPEGVYIYQLTDENGSRISGGKLMLIH